MKIKNYTTGAQAEAEYDMFLVDLATFMHDEYEKMAKVVGWKTQESCRVEFKDLPPANKTVMIAVAEAVYKRLRK